MAPDYILVDSRVKEPLIEALRSEITRQYGTNPTLNENYPRIINEKHEQRLNELLADQPVVYGGLWNQHKLLPDIGRRSGSQFKFNAGRNLRPDPSDSDLYAFQRKRLRFIQQREKPLAAYLFSRKS